MADTSLVKLLCSWAETLAMWRCSRAYSW